MRSNRLHPRASGARATSPSRSLPLWVVNLRRSHRRRAYIEGHLRALGLDFEIVAAADGGALDAQALSRVYDPAAAVRSIGRDLAPGEIGCALSHLDLYRRMLDQGIDEVLILEDDAAVQAAALQLLERVDDLPADREIVLLNHLPEIGGRLSWWHRRRLGALRLGRFYRPAYGTAGYLIRRSAARKILDAAYPVRAPADHWTGGESRLDLRIYGVYPPCIEQLGAHALGGPTIANRQDLRSRWNLPAPPAGIGLILHRTKRRLVDGWLMLDPRRTI